MSGSARKRNSKWETQEDYQFLHRGMQENDWHESRITPTRDNRSRVWRSPEVAGVSRTHWSSMGRGSQRDDNIIEHRGRTLDTMTRWEGGERYGSRLSPDLDEFRLQNHHHSPKNGWRRQRRSRSRSRSQSQPRASRRSRSRSPVHSFRRDSGDYDKSRGRLGTSSQLCRNFAAGRCRRGDRCLFIHQDPQNYEDRFEGRQRHVRSMHSDHYVSREDPGRSPRSTDWCEDFLKGNCRRGTTCRFSHPSDPNASGMVMKNEAGRERNDRSRDMSLEGPGERETHRASDVPCKFFAAGNCRNGKRCRFSHHDHAHASPDKRSSDGRWPLSHYENGSENLWNGPTCSELNTSSDTLNISDDKYAKVGAPDWVTGWSMDETCGKSLDDNRTPSVPVVGQKAVDMDRKESVQSMTDHLGDSLRDGEQGATKCQIEDVEMSPEWIYRPSLPSQSDKGELNSLHSSETNDYTETSGIVMQTVFNGLSSVQQNYNLRELGAAALPSEDKAFTGKTADSCDISANFLGAEGFNETGLALNPVSLPCLNDFGQSQFTVNTESLGALGITSSLIQTLSQEGKAVSKLDEGNTHASQVSSGIPKTQNSGSNEQLSQLIDLEASLVQFIANASGQNLSQYYAANDPYNGKEMPSFANPDGSVEPASAVGIRELIAEGKPEAPLKNLSSVASSPSNRNGDRNKFNTSEKEPSDVNCRLNKLEPSLNLELTNKSFRMGTKESGKTEETAEDHGFLETNEGDVAGDDRKHRYRQGKVEWRKAQENHSLENLGENKNADKSKESKDTKVLRPFKFALAEFVKELLKPKWKEGHMSKDSYKIIVKKVVDKVTITMQGANIPHTPEKIEQYLSVSKPKLAKLVQAYVEKFQKEK